MLPNGLNLRPSRALSSTIWLLLGLFIVGCTDTDKPEAETSPEAQADATLDTPPGVESSDGPPCVYNQAYQENYQEDAASDLVSLAHNCYVLIDTSTPEPVAAIPELKKQGNTIGCYTSIGTGEEWRTDFDQLQPFLVDGQWDEWPGEFFVNNTAGALPIMKMRIEQLAAQGCDWVEFDNMDWAGDSENRTKYGLTVGEEEAAVYANEICEFAHSLDLLCMAKNLRLTPNAFDDITFESFPEERDWWTHDHLQDFLDGGSLVVMFHYDETDCSGVSASYTATYGEGISFLCEDRSLGAYRHQ